MTPYKPKEVAAPEVSRQEAISLFIAALTVEDQTNLVKEHSQSLDESVRPWESASLHAMAPNVSEFQQLSLQAGFPFQLSYVCVCCGIPALLRLHKEDTSNKYAIIGSLSLNRHGLYPPHVCPPG